MHRAGPSLTTCMCRLGQEQKYIVRVVQEGQPDGYQEFKFDSENNFIQSGTIGRMPKRELYPAAARRLTQRITAVLNTGARCSAMTLKTYKRLSSYIKLLCI